MDDPGEGGTGAASRDSSHIAAGYVEHSEDLRLFLLGVLKNRELAAEVLQATFSKALEAKNPPREQTLRSWLFQVAFREAVSVRRRQQIHRRAMDGMQWVHPTTAESSEAVVSREELIARVRAALECLPDEQRTVVRKRIYEDKTFAEIAAETGAPLGTVLTRMRLAMAKLHEQLKTN